MDAVDSRLLAEARSALLNARADWERRLEKIGADRRRQSAPLERDSEEQAVQRENDETLDALDVRGRRQLEAIAAALERIDAGSFGRCMGCGEPITPERLRAQPTAVRCLACAEVAS